MYLRGAFSQQQVACDNIQHNESWPRKFEICSQSFANGGTDADVTQNSFVTSGSQG